MLGLGWVLVLVLAQVLELVLALGLALVPAAVLGKEWVLVLALVSEPSPQVPPQPREQVLWPYLLGVALPQERSRTNDVMSLMPKRKTKLADSRVAY